MTIRISPFSVLVLCYKSYLQQYFKLFLSQKVLFVSMETLLAPIIYVHPRLRLINKSYDSRPARSSLLALH